MAANNNSQPNIPDDATSLQLNNVVIDTISIGDTISVDSAIQCSTSSEQSSISGLATDHGELDELPMCRICLCSNDEIEIDPVSELPKKSKFKLNLKKKTEKKPKKHFMDIDPKDPFRLISPCNCIGTHQFVHHNCLQHWVRTSNRSYCDMCLHPFVMHTKNKPLIEWEFPKITSHARRHFLFRLTVNLFATLFVLWALRIIMTRAAEDYLFSPRKLTVRSWAKILIISFTSFSGMVFIYHHFKTAVKCFRIFQRYNQIVIIDNIIKDTLPPTNKSSALQSIVAIEPEVDTSTSNLSSVLSESDVHIVLPNDIKKV